MSFTVTGQPTRVFGVGSYQVSCQAKPTEQYP